MKIKKKQIENRYTSRRQFLVGAGQSMMFLPPLISLMPRVVAAQVANQKKLRTVFYMGTLGIQPTHLYPTNPTGMMTDVAFKTKYKDLTSFSGPISRMIDSSFTSILPDMNLVEGLSMTGGLYNAHNRGVLSAIQSHGRSPQIGRSVDVVLEKYAPVYGNHVPLHKAVRIDHGGHQSSFSHDGGTISSAIKGDLSLYNTLFASFQSQPSGPSQSQINKELVVDRVYADLKKLENHPRLSKSDKDILQRYVAGMFDLQKKVKANQVVPNSCSKPSLNLQVTQNSNGYQFPHNPGWGIRSTDALFDNYIEMIRMAFICDLTRIFVIESDIWSDSPISPWSQGGLHHECANSETSADRHQFGLKKMAKLAEALRSTSDPHNSSGNMLDNSMVFWSNELGDWTAGHFTWNMPVVTFGKLGGFFKSGYYMDYRNQTRKPVGDRYWGNRHQFYGRPMKQILQSIMLGMGVPKSEYMKYGDGSGFGEFKEDVSQFNGYMPGLFTPYRNEHNDKLPFLT